MRERVRLGIVSAKDWADSIPLVTKWLVVVLLCVHFVATGALIAVSSVCFSLAALRSLQVYRAVVSIFVHLGWLHLLLNCSALVSLGVRLERLMGSARFAVAIASAVVLNIFVHALVELVLVWFFAAECSAGFSGVLFSLYVLDLADRGPMHRVAACFLVPTAVAPFVLIALTQLFLHASFGGHLAGVLVGYVLKQGLPGWLSAGEGWIEERCCHMPGFAVASSVVSSRPVESGWSGLKLWSGVQAPVDQDIEEALPQRQEERQEELGNLLVSMGFDRRASLRALVLSGGSLEGAVVMLSEPVVV